MAGPTAESNPNAFVGKVTLSAYEPYPLITGSNYSSVAPQSVAIVRWVQPQPIWVKNIVMQNSLAAGVPAATGQASTGSEGFSYALTAFLFSRQDYVSNSSNISFVGSGSFGLSATLGYSSTSQQFGMSWATDTTGGTLATTMTSSDAAWSNYANGPRVYSLPFVSTLTAGEYWIGFQHSSTSATSNSNVTLLSVSKFQMVGQQASASAGYIGQSTTANTVYGPVQNAGVINTTPTTNATMPLSTVIVAGRPIWFALSNA